MKQPDEDMKMKHKKPLRHASQLLGILRLFFVIEKNHAVLYKQLNRKFYMYVTHKVVDNENKGVIASCIGYFRDKLTVELASWRLLGKVILFSLFRHFCWSFFYIYYTTHLLLPVHHIIYYIIPSHAF